MNEQNWNRSKDMASARTSGEFGWRWTTRFHQPEEFINAEDRANVITGSGRITSSRSSRRIEGSTRSATRYPCTYGHSIDLN